MEREISRNPSPLPVSLHHTSARGPRRELPRHSHCQLLLVNGSFVPIGDGSADCHLMVKRSLKCVSEVSQAAHVQEIQLSQSSEVDSRNEVHLLIFIRNSNPPVISWL